MRILVGYDGSTAADAAIADLRRAGCPEQTEALVVCVEDGRVAEAGPAESKSERSWTSRLAGAEMLAEKAAGMMSSFFPQWTISSEALWGSPAKILLDTSGRWHPDLIVVGSHGHSAVKRFLLGSVSLELIHKAACSVRVARTGRPDTGNPIRIVIGHDGSAEAEAVIRSVAGRSWPKDTEAKIISAAQTIVPVTTILEASTYAQEPAYSVIQEADERVRCRLRNIAAESADTLRRSGISAKWAVVDGDPREAILLAAETWKADAIFAGARGLGRMQRLLLGSVSSYVVTHAACAVEVVRGHHV